MADEFELKFQIPSQRLAELETTLQRAPVTWTRLRARYFDTPDAALARAGLVLRIRQEGDKCVQTAKGPGRGGFERLEHEFRLEPGACDAPPAIARHHGHPVHDLLERALRHSAGDLQPTFETDVMRQARTESAAGALVEIALDQGEVRSGARSHPVQEIEFELKEGASAALIELARNWCRSHALWLDPQTKSALGRRLAQEETTVPAVKAQPVREAGHHLVAAMVDAALAQVLGNARELAAGAGDHEHVHQLRVGIRRLRVMLHDEGGVAPKALRKLAGERLQALHSRMKAGRRFGELPQDARHRVRKRLKRLRYLAELVQPLYDEGEVDAYVAALEKLQDALGRYQDAVAARALFEERARHDPAAWFGAGWLAACEGERARVCRGLLQGAARGRAVLEVARELRPRALPPSVR